MMRIWWDEWRGSLDGRPTLWIKRLFGAWGWRTSLHMMVKADDAECFHTHPATAIRVILAGGYVEELEGGVEREWRPGMVGIVRPALSHRIARLRGDRSFSLWIRAPKSAAIQLRGAGFAAKVEP